MENLYVPRVVEAERYKDGVIIGFDDGKNAIYPATFLYAAHGLVTIMSEPDELLDEIVPHA